MVKKKESKNFFKRWSEKKSGLEKDISGNESKIKKRKKHQILESNEDVDKKYEKMSNKEILEKLKLPDPNKVKTEDELNLFFKSSIPERLKRIAMRRLWRINPIISFADAEINDYADDFTDAANVIEDLKTSYVVGQGYASPKKDNDLEEEEIEQVQKTEKNKITKKTKEVKNKKGLKGEEKVKIKKDEKPQDKQIITSDKNLDKKFSSMSSGQKIQNNEKDTEPAEETNNLTKIKPKNLLFKRK